MGCALATRTPVNADGGPQCLASARRLSPTTSPAQTLIPSAPFRCYSDGGRGVSNRLLAGSPFGKRRREEPIDPRPRPWRRAASFLEGAWLAGGAQILSSCDSVKTDVPDRARPRPGPITRDDREGMDTHPRPSRLRPPNASQGAGEAPEISSESDEEDASRWEPHGETRIPLTAPVGRSESYTVKPVPTAARRSCNGDNHA